MKNKFKILVIGCGELGSRHLQAVATLSEVAEIDVIDRDPRSLEIAKNRVTDLADKNPKIRFQWLTDIKQAGKEGDLCIIGTMADVRLRVFQEVLAELDYKQFLLEKIVTQSTADYETMLQLAHQHQSTVWINCKSRVYPSHKRVKAMLKPEEPLHYSVIGGNHGLGNNGVHAADLFAFFEEPKEIRCEKAMLDPILHPSKRGTGKIFDLSGVLHGSTERGSHFTLSFMNNSDTPPHYALVSKSYHAIIDDVTQTFWESRIENNWVWEKIPYRADGKEENLLVSQMTKIFAADILNKKTCELPLLKDCYAPHKFILDAVQPHFSKLLGRSITHCPVT